MRHRGRWAAFFGLCAELSALGCVSSWFYTPPEAVVSAWAVPSAQAARRLIEEYGAPEIVRSDRLIWIGNGPWKRTTVWDQAPLYVPTAADDSEVMEQTLDYPLTASQAERLRAFSSALVADASRGELSARSNREEVNRLNLNLAVEIVAGRKSVEEARRQYARTLEFEAAGKSSPYMEGLLFKFGP